MSIPFAGERTDVTCVIRMPTGRDDYGNAITSTNRIVVPACLVAWDSSQDENEDANRVVTSATIYDLSNTWPGGTVNAVEIEGDSWEIVGDPQRWPGSLGGTVIRIRKVSG